MVSQQLRVYAPPVARRCLELGRHNPDYNIGIQHGLDISTDWVSSPFVLYHTIQAIVTLTKQDGRLLHLGEGGLGARCLSARALSRETWTAWGQVAMTLFSSFPEWQPKSQHMLKECQMFLGRYVKAQ